MNRKEKFSLSTKLKLKLYEEYLKGFLAVLSNSKYFSQIEIIDLFSGLGRSESGISGSAEIAAKQILRYSSNPRFSSKKYVLRLNERNRKRHEKLRSHMEKYAKHNIIEEISREKADDFLARFQPKSGSISLFFADQFGYRGFDIRKAIRLLKEKGKCEFIIFLSVNEIFRFLQADFSRPKEDLNLPLDFGEDNSIAEVSHEEKENPSLTFLNNICITSEEAMEIKNVSDLAQLIRMGIKRVSGQEFVYLRHLKVANESTYNCLYFITTNKKGAEKFIEAIDSAEKGLPNLAFDFVLDTREELKNFIRAKGGIVSNSQITDYCRLEGIKPSKLVNSLDNLEFEGVISVKSTGKKARRGRSFYIGFGKGSEVTLQIKLEK